ncbi:MAG: flagellar brake protein [Clostridiales bacterium]
MKISSNTIRLGTKIEVVFINSNTNEKGAFISRFEDIKNEKIIIDAPIRRGKIINFDIKTKLLVYFIHNCDLYRFKAMIISKYKKDNLYYLEIKKTDIFENVQRREFYRYKTILDLDFRMKDIENKFKAFAKDISGGGICLVTNKKLVKDNILNCKLYLKDGSEIEFEGKVIREKNIESSYSKSEYGVKFFNISYKDRESIIRYIFIEEIKLRKKGLI